MIENVSRIRQASLSRCGGDGEQKKDAAANVPGDRARGRRGHPHALDLAESAARGRWPHPAGACARSRDQGRRRRHCRRGRARSRSGRARSACAGAEGEDFRTDAAARHRACGAGGARGDRAAARRYSGDVRRHAAGAAADPARIAGGAGARRGRGRARVPAGESRRLRPADHARQRTLGHRRGSRRDAGAKRDHFVQWGADGVRRQNRAQNSRSHQ